MNKNIEIIQPDDWHVHFREGDMLEMVTNFSSRSKIKFTLDLNIIPHMHLQTQVME